MTETQTPVLHCGRTTKHLHWWVLAALLCPVGGAIWRVGAPAAILVGTAAVAAWLGQVIVTRRVARHDGSIITGVILALTLPATSPFWLSPLGAMLAIVVGKHLAGGAGNTLFNPAAVGRALLMGLVPGVMFAAQWPTDAISTASPLAKEIDSVLVPWVDLFMGDHPGSLADAGPLFVLGGGVVLLLARVVDGWTPLCYFGAISLFSMILPPSGRIEGHAPWLATNPLFHLVGGGTLMVGFFMLTDPVTSPFTRRGRIVFAVTSALFVMLVRTYTVYPDAGVLSVLFANALVPLIDRRTI
ncbi:MAG: RnfABCDGE type electron transport complex subunit D [Myxococcales bacterium]|nr:RnfABCDGE type electron transport complex subunit D [Myxococcales bacterium]